MLKISHKLIFSSLVGFIFLWPHLFIPLLQNKEDKYSPIAIENVSTMTFDETHTYAARIRRVFEGELIVRDPLIYEYRHGPNQSTTFPPLILGMIAKILGSVEAVFILSDFLFPFISSLILLTFLKKLGLKIYFSTLTTASILSYSFRTDDWNNFIINFLKTISNFDTIHLQSYLNSVTRQLEYGRLDSPEFTFILLLGAIYFLYLLFTSRKKNLKSNLKNILLSGMFFGLLFYSYAYYWIFFLFGALSTAGVLILLKETKKAFSVITVLILGLFMSVSFWKDYLAFKNLTQFNEISLRLGWESGMTAFTRESWYIILLILVIIVVYIKIQSRYQGNLLFITSFLVGGIVCLNFRSIFGWGVQTWHFYMRIVYPWMVLSSFIALFYFLTKFNYKKIKYFAIISTILVILASFGIQTLSSINMNSSFKISKELSEAFAWLNKNTPKNSVIASPSITTNYLLPTFTHNYIYLPDGLLSSASNQEILDRTYFLYSLYNVPEDFSNSLFTSTKNNNAIFKRAYGVSAKDMELFGREWYLLHRTPNPEDLKLSKVHKQLTYKIDYLWFGKYEEIIGASLNENKYKLVFQNPSVKIYKLK
ncbi:MAG: hypothetical protein M1365_01080 [Actinobacteria bacterium]|nr:hypothetical protein [Actinomycetota bacterium]